MKLVIAFLLGSLIQKVHLYGLWAPPRQSEIQFPKIVPTFIPFCQLSSMPTDNNKNKNFNDFCPSVTSTTSSQANQHEFECVKTATKGYVHMKTCSSNWIDSTIRGYCQDTHPVNSSLWLTVPVTKNGITFKNIFCLLCQNEKPTDWSFWELGFSCVDQSTGLAAKILEGSANFSAFKPYEAGFWTYTKAEKKYTCFLHPEVPTNSNYSRCCQVPNTKKAQNTCFSNDSHVYADCVIQSSHNVSKNHLCNPMPTKMNMTFKVKLTKEMIPSFPHCDRILKNITRYNITCPPNTTTSNRPSTKCPFNKFFQVNSSESSKYEYLKDDWLYMSNTTIYICKAPESGQLSLPFNSSMLTGTNKNENFDDFCPNGISISNNALQHEFQCVKTATNGYVHMKTCSSNWIDSTIRGYCQDTHPVNSSLWLSVPVTKNGITFKNIFCLLCQNEKPTDWSFWELGFSCVDQSTGLAAKILEGSAKISALKPYEAGFWTHTEAEKKYTCFLHPEVPTNSNYSRCCQVPYTKKAQNTCFSNDSHVYADCVIQSYHNVSENNLCNPTPTEMNMTFKVKLKKDMIPSFPHCDRIPKNTSSYNITCTPNTATSYQPSTKCPFNKFFQVNSFESSKYEYLKDDWLYMSNTTIYICKAPESCQLSLPFSSAMLTGTNNRENFNDFCPNGSSTSNNIHQHEFECVKTATNGYVYMKTCSSTWTDSTIRGYCEATNPANSSLWLTVPVTQNGTTFKNIFCLTCQNETPTNWSFWELGFSCVDQSTGLAAKILEGSAKISALKPYEAGFWTYTEAEKQYTCFSHPEASRNSNYSWCCKTPITEKAQNTCWRNGSHVYADCVIQSNIVSKNQSCNPMAIKMNLTLKMNLTKEMVPSFPHCHRLPNNTDLYNITCQPRTASTLVLRKCPTDKYFSVNSSDISIKGTLLQVKSLNQQFSKHDWFYINETKYLCLGHEITCPSSSSKTLPSTLTSCLLISSSLGLVVHSLFFFRLPHKKLWDKCFLIFRTLLLVQSLCVIYGTFHSYTHHVSILWHYSILGCSTWILLLSYDFQVNLFQAVSFDDVPHSQSHTKFWWYSIISLGLPLLLAGPIFYFGPSQKLPEDTGHGCLLNETPLTFFWLSAVILSLATGYFLLRIAYMAILDRQLRYIRQNLHIPGKAVLSMIALWMLGSLWMLAAFEMTDWLLHTLHVLQAVLLINFSFYLVRGRFKKAPGKLPVKYIREKDSRLSVTTNTQPTSNAE